MKFRQALQVLTLLPALAWAAAPDCISSPQVALDKIEARVIVVGEVHGTEQAPAFVAQLVCGLLKQGRPVILALERNGAEQGALNRYLASPGQAADVQALLSADAWASPQAQDGRSSRAMLQLIEHLRQWRQAGQRVGVLAMQQSFLPLTPSEGGPRQRPSDAELARFSEINDRSMADNVWMAAAGHASYTVVVLAGNVHTALGSATRSRFVPTPSLTDVLSGYLPIHIIGLHSKGGSSWNMSAQGVGPQSSSAGPLFMADARIDSQVELGAVTASPPAASAR